MNPERKQRLDAERTRLEELLNGRAFKAELEAVKKRYDELFDRPNLKCQHCGEECDHLDPEFRATAIRMILMILLDGGDNVDVTDALSCMQDGSPDDEDDW